MSTLTEPHIAAFILGHTLTETWQVYDQHEYLPEKAKLRGNLIQHPENLDRECIKAKFRRTEELWTRFPRKHGHAGLAAKVSTRHEAPEALRATGVTIVYQRGFAPSELRLVLGRNLARSVRDTS